MRCPLECRGFRDMALEDVEWQERYGDQSYKATSLNTIRVVLAALFFSHVVVLPSIAVYLGSMNAPISMLGYCIAAVCVGEYCADIPLSFWYDKRPAREAVAAALLINTAGSLLYALAPNQYVVLLSRFIVGCSLGVQGPLLTLVGSFTNRYNRARILESMRLMYTLAFILGAGLSAPITFVHMHSPGIPVEKMDRTLRHLAGNKTASAHSSAGLGFGGIVGRAITSGEVEPWEWIRGGSWLASAVQKEAAAWGVEQSKHDLPGSRRRLLGDLRGELSPLLRIVGNAGGLANLNAERGGSSSNGERLVGLNVTAAQGNETVGNVTYGEGGVVNKVADAPDAEQVVDEGEEGVMTDTELKKSLGNRMWYLPGYLTELVGAGLTAPGYMAALLSTLTTVGVWFNLSDGPRKALTQRVPIAHLSPTSLRYFTPLVACVALESFTTIALVCFETLVAPMMRIWAGWSVDAVAVLMMAIAASGVVSLATLDLLRRHYPLRALLKMALLTSLVGLALCIPWEGHLVPSNFVVGCCLASFGAWTITSVSHHIVAEAIIKVYSEDGELVWLQMFWSITRVPWRVVGPLMLIWLLERDPTGGLCYAAVLACGFIAALVLVYFRTLLITPKVGNEADVLPALDLAIHGPGSSSFGGRRFAPEPLI